MKIQIPIDGKMYTTDLSQGHNISITLDPNSATPKCFWAPDFTIEPVQTEHFIGDIKQGGLVNFKNLHINPHGNGTHTECVGHIIDGDYYISDAMVYNQFHISSLTSIEPSTDVKGDKVITKNDLETQWNPSLDSLKTTALVIRTLPNSHAKLTTDYSGTNPPYLDVEAIKYINEKGIQHLIIDLPSVDREEDGGALAGHKAFWGVDIAKIDTKKTITELVYVDNDIKDGVYLCQISPLKIKCDASPSNIVLYPLIINHE